MKSENSTKTATKKRAIRSAKECAYIAVFVSLVIATQWIFSAIPGIELVTVLFISYAFVFGWQRGVLVATVFSLLRQLIFGFFATVLILYLVYYCMVAILFGFMGKRTKLPARKLWLVLLCACACSVMFTLFDCVLTPLWYGYAKESAVAYFYASIPFAVSQTICVGVSTAILFLPLQRVFRFSKRAL